MDNELGKPIFRFIWNTGRLYQKNGQVIVAELHKDFVLFHDMSRMIAGEMELPSKGYEIDSTNSLRDYVMWRYDHNKYKYNSHAYRLTDRV